MCLIYSVHPIHFPATDAFEAGLCWTTCASSHQDENKAIGYQTFCFCPSKGRSSESADLILSKQPLLMTLMWNGDYMKIKVRKTPLLPTSHIKHYIYPNSNFPRALPLLVSARDKSQCPAVRHRRHLPCLYERPESWAGGQIPTSCLLFLRSTPRAGQRQNSRKTSCVPILPEHLQGILCTASSKAAAFCLGTSTSPCSAAQAIPLFGKDEETEPCQCLFWPDWALPELTASQHPRECLSRPLKTNTSSSQSLTSTYPRAKV